MAFWREQKTTLRRFVYVGIVCFFSFWHTTTTHKQHHHGELLLPPAVRFLQLDPIQRKPDADEGFGEGSVEAIQLNRLTGRVKK
jgi:hypothetical protein